MTRFYKDLEIVFQSLEYKDLKQAYEEMKSEDFIKIVEKESVKLYREGFMEGGKQYNNLIKGLDSYKSLEEVIDKRF